MQVLWLVLTLAVFSGGGECHAVYTKKLPGIAKRSRAVSGRNMRSSTIQVSSQASMIMTGDLQSAIQVSSQASMLLRGNHHSKAMPTDGITAIQSMNAQQSEYTLSGSGDTRQVARLEVNPLTGQMQTFDSRNLNLSASDIEAYQKLEEVILSSGWNSTTADGNLFEDGHGITAKLYKEYLAPGSALYESGSGATVCETGFGGGHGVLYTMLICDTCHVYVFDIGARPYSRPVAEYLEKEYPGKLTMTWGDSATTLPQFKIDHPDVTCDFVMIDGGRSYDMAKADTVNFAQLISSPTTAVLQHDCPVPGRNDTVNGLCRGWHELVNSGCVLNNTEYPTVSLGHLDVANCKH